MKMMKLCKTYPRLVSLLVLIVLINSDFTKCEKEVNKRQKRTIGVFFRSLFDSSQTQRQPAPTVISHQPQRLNCQSYQHQQPSQSVAPCQQQIPQKQQQSASLQLLASSKNLLQQKLNAKLPKSPTPNTPEVEFISASKNPSAPANPAPPSSIVPQEPQTPIYQNPPQNFPPSAPSNIPNHPLSHLQGHRMILPFQIHPGPPPTILFQPHLTNGPPSFNYQAEIYLYPPGNPGQVYPPQNIPPGNEVGVYPQHNLPSGDAREVYPQHNLPSANAGEVYPQVNLSPGNAVEIYPQQDLHQERYSPNNGWHDADKISSRGPKPTQRETEGDPIENKHDGYTQYKAEPNSDATNKKENSINGRRMDYNEYGFYDEKNYPAQPFIINHYSSNEVSNNGYPVFDIYNDNSAIQQVYYPEQLNVEISSKKNYNNGNFSTANEKTGKLYPHDYVTQGMSDLKSGLEERLQKHLKHGEVYFFQNSNHHSDKAHNHGQWYFGENQHPTKIGRLPDFPLGQYTEQQNYFQDYYQNYKEIK